MIQKSWFYSETARGDLLKQKSCHEIHPFFNGYSRGQVSVNWLSSDTSPWPDPHCSWPAREAMSVKPNQQKHWLKTDPKTLNSSSRCRDNKTSSAVSDTVGKRKTKTLLSWGVINQNIPTFRLWLVPRPNKTTPVQLMLRNGSHGISTSINA